MVIANKMRLVWSVCLVLTALTGCKMFEKEHADERSSGRALDDKDITAAVQEKLKKEPTYKFSTVDVKTYSGLVQLSGFVNSEDQRQRAGELAQGVPGVSRVVNNIMLKSQDLVPTGTSAGTNQPSPEPPPTP